MVDVLEAAFDAQLSFSDATCDYNNDPTIACDASADIRPGLAVTGTGIPAGSFVKSVNTLGAVTSFELGDGEGGSDVSTTTGSVTNGTLTFSPGLGDLAAIKVAADTAVCDCEIFVASVA